jgi:hypothetical protein
VIEARDGAIHTRLGSAEHPGATLTGQPRPILGLLLGLIGLPQAEAGGIEFRGDQTILDRVGANVSPRREAAHESD